MASLILVCPACQASYPVEAGLADAQGRHLLKAAVGLWPPELQPSVLAYLGLFTPSQRKLRLATLLRQVEAFVALVSAGTVTRHRETRNAPLAAWGDGLAEVLKLQEAGTLTLPLTGHGLLGEIVHRAAGQRQSQDAAAQRPLHPSHRLVSRPPDPLTPALPRAGGREQDSATLPSPPAGEGLGERGASPRDAQARQTGLHQVGALAQALKGRQTVAAALAARGVELKTPNLYQATATEPQSTLNPGLTAPDTSDNDHE